jgi:multidrug transporter EmrE-like cation transporter
MSKSSEADDTHRPNLGLSRLSLRSLALRSDSRAPERPKHKRQARRIQLSVGSVALLLFAVISAATGQVMLKHGMQIASARANSAGSSLAFAAATSPWVLSGLVVFGVSAVAWLGALSKVPLSVAYPFNAIGYLVILTASIVVLHERANMLTWAGSLLVVSGVVIVVLSRP